MTTGSLEIKLVCDAAPMLSGLWRASDAIFGLRVAQIVGYHPQRLLADQRGDTRAREAFARLIDNITGPGGHHYTDDRLHRIGVTSPERERIEMLPFPTEIVSDYATFQREMLAKIGASLGLTYAQLSQDFESIHGPARPLDRVSYLLQSFDPRQRKRGRRLARQRWRRDV